MMIVPTCQTIQVCFYYFTFNTLVEDTAKTNEVSEDIELGAKGYFVNGKRISSVEEAKSNSSDEDTTETA